MYILLLSTRFDHDKEVNREGYHGNLRPSILFTVSKNSAVLEDGMRSKPGIIGKILEGIESGEKQTLMSCNNAAAFCGPRFDS